ncbi:uncharacterized protein [Lolium perenne]|uniref:uncharacterized protein n=1 Tax=Lolium perenne TaxID=4522 RepID=UPI003A98FBC7
MRGDDCLSYKIRETMPPKRFKPTPTDAAKYDGQQEPGSWIDDYLHTVILHKGNQIATMQCLQLYLKNSTQAWFRGLPKGSIKSWDDLVAAFVKNFQETYKRHVEIDELRHCQQKPKESMRTYIGMFTKLLNAAEDVSVDRAIDAFSDGIRRESYIEELGRKKLKTITKLMEIANSWADGEDNINAPCYLHAYIDPKDDKKKLSHLLRDCRQFFEMQKFIQQQQPSPPPPPQHQVQQVQPRNSNESFPPPRGQMSMIHKTGVSRREMKKLTQEINLAESIMANIPEYIDWSPQSIMLSRADHPLTIPKPDHAALVVEAQIGGFNMSKVFMDGGSGLNLIFLNTVKNMRITMRMLEETDTCFHGILPTLLAYSLGKVYLNVVFGKPDNFRKEKMEFERIAAKFGIKQELVDFPSKSLALDDKEDERVKKLKKKPDDPAPKVSAVGPSVADSKASAEDSKALALAASTPVEINDASKATGTLDKIEDKKNPPLV